MHTLVQLFSARDFLPWENVLDQITHLGFNGVEGFFQNFEDPEGFRAALDARGLKMPQAHVPLQLLEGDFDKAVQIARKLGVHMLIGPWLPPEERPSTSDGWRALGIRLNTIESKLRQLGLRFAWHNHDFEMVTLSDGAVPMEILLEQAPGMDWEVDIGWILRAGLDPIAWLTKWSGRIVSVHLKDLQPNFATAPEGGWADLGHGTSDWRPIFATLSTLPRLAVHVAEHDAPADLSRFLSRWKTAHERLSSFKAGNLFEGYTHVTLMVRDIEKELDFYTRVIGLPEMFRLLRDDGSLFIVYLRLNDRQYLELFPWGVGDEPAAPNARGMHHMCLEVADLDYTVTTLMQRGATMSQWRSDATALDEVEGPAIRVGLDGNRQSWMKDPEGNRIELMEMATDSMQYQAIARLRRL
jgi:sugar phosphate isomerase/epimerase/catechol 2,3-dioxygenase-like lactoylglutathione lyase family enzyme